MIRINKPFIEDIGNHSRLISNIEVDGEIRPLWAEVDSKYKDYLCYERADAFVIGLLYYAMMHNHDIVCEVPMGEDLYYQISTYLIEAYSKWSPNKYKIVLHADVDEHELPCAGKVGTGISCGIDSFHVLAHLTNTQLVRHKLTHLTFNNVGSHGEGEQAIKLYNERKKNAESFCREYGYDLVEINSNIMDQFPQSHVRSHTYSSTFAVFALQKLYSIYYYASGCTFKEFSFRKEDPAYQDLFLLNMFSTDKLKMYSEGGVFSRLEKTQAVTEYRPSYKYLNVCIKTSNNCGVCEKCVRTLLALDALDKLEEYKDVFDIGYYRSHKFYYLKNLIAQKLSGNSTYIELYPYFKKRHEISILTIMRSIPLAFKLYMKKHYSKNAFIKNVYKNIKSHIH